MARDRTAYIPSWYSASADLPAPAPRLEGDQRADVVVIGGGFTGLTASLELAQKGYDVALLEARRVGWGASGRNGGQIVTGHNKSPSELAALVGPDDGRQLWDLGEEAKQMLAQRIADHAIDCDLRWGYLFAGIKQRHRDELARMVDEWRAVGYHHARLLDRAQTREQVASPRYIASVLDSGSGQLHPLKYALGLARAAREAGVRIHEDSTVTDITVGDPVVARTPRGSITAPFAVVAGNAYLHLGSPGIQRRLRPRIMPVGTFIIATEALGDNRATATIPSGHAVADIKFVLDYFRLSPDTRMLFGGRVSYTGRQGPSLAKGLRRRMLTVFPELHDVKVDHLWGGWVAITLNRLPDIGRIAPNMFYAQGFSGHGVALTGIAGRVMAEAVAGTAERLDVFERIPHADFPGGRVLRMPALALGMMWYRLRDML